jgi:hypothetical protein
VYKLTGQVVPTTPSSTPIFECPVALYPNILKFADTPTLARCMRVSSEFSKIASKRLYNNVIVKGTNGMSKVLAEHRPAANDDTLPSKSTLLTTVQQLTVFTHTCGTSPFSDTSFPDLQTLLIIPRATCRRARWVCNEESCPILDGARPQKVVFHNSRRNYDRKFENETASWPLGVHDFDVNCPTLTVVIDEAELLGEEGAQYQMDKYWRVSNVKTIRIIVLPPTPAWLDKIAQRAKCRCRWADVEHIASHILSPLMIDQAYEFIVYVFRPLDPDGTFLKELGEYFEDERYAFAFKPTPPSYCFKTLADYIAEGVEDEFLIEELQYWREENQRRLKKGAGHYRANERCSEGRQPRDPSRLL